jgi:hypothetical protein
MANKLPSYLTFDASTYAWKAHIDYQEHPELYRVGKGEQGVLICEPYKSELVKLWRFKTPAVAKESSHNILKLFYNFLRKKDFVGADMARKFLQMGYTRARRYANYKGGKKYAKEDYHLLPRGTGDPQKAESARIFYEKWQEAEHNPEYSQMKKAWKIKFG